MMFLPLLFGFLLQATTPSSLPNAYTQLMPLVILALLVDVMIVVIWYYIGVALNNSGIKTSAKGEFYQFIGTCIMIAIIIAVLVFASSAFYSVMGASALMKPAAISAMCSNIMGTTSLDIIGKTNSLLSGPQTSSGTGNFPGLCTLVASNTLTAGNGDITTKLDYPLSATAVVIANLTNQTAANLNYSFTVDAWIGFLSRLSPMLNLCIDPQTQGVSCMIPNPVLAPLFILKYTNTPYSGYYILTSNLATFGSLLNFSVESFIAQLLLVTIFIYIWPYLLFVGLILRSTFLTRRIGGLLIAAALAGLLIFPMVYSFEYLAIGNGMQQTVSSSSSPTGYNSIYGFNAVTSLPGNTAVNNGNYVINFFVQPNIKTIANALNCWPGGASGSILTYGTPVPPGLWYSEMWDIFALALPGKSTWNAVKNLVSAAPLTSAPALELPVNCVPSAALNTFYALLNAYGLIGLDSYLLPLINLVIFITSVIGLSGLFGGDTELMGLSRLV